MESRKHILLTDCDGTLTNVAGGNLVFTKHYNIVVATDELALELKHNQDSIATLQQTIKTLTAQIDKLSEQLDKLIQAQLEEHPLEKSGIYTLPTDDQNISSSSDSIDKDDSLSLAQLKENIDTLKKNRAQLEAAKKKNHESFYSLMGSKKLSPQEIAQRSLAILGKMRTHPHADFNLANGAKEFLENLLNDGSVDIHIVTKNHEEYIRALLLHNGFSEEQVNKMQIHDIRKGGGNKERKTTELLSGYPGIKSYFVTICDDSLSDCRAMERGAAQLNLTAKAYQRNPGDFDFNHIEGNMLRPVPESPEANARKKELRTSQLGIMGKRTRSLDTLKEDSSPLSPRKGK